nr:MAG TPA: hypothetical protein [Caudoviricetes sp.]
MISLLYTFKIKSQYFLLYFITINCYSLHL